MAGGVAVINVGAATETELKEKKHRIEDALCYCAAVEEGIVPGGGVTLVNAISAVEALEEEGDIQTESTSWLGLWPIRCARLQPTPVWKVQLSFLKLLSCRQARLQRSTGEFVNMFDAGIVDPAKVTRSALQNAASIAALLLTTEALIADQPEEEPAAGAVGGMPPMM